MKSYSSEKLWCSRLIVDGYEYLNVYRRAQVATVHSIRVHSYFYMLVYQVQRCIRSIPYRTATSFLGQTYLKLLHVHREQRSVFASVRGRANQISPYNFTHGFGEITLEISVGYFFHSFHLFILVIVKTWCVVYGCQKRPNNIF